MAYDKGYGASGASLTRRATKGFRAQSGSPREDIDFNNYTLRQRGRLMDMGNPIAASAIKTYRTNAIGLGLRPNPRPDMDFLGLTMEQRDEWVRTVKREFDLWAGRKQSCDAAGVNDFYDMQQMLFKSWLASGDAFVLVEQGAATTVSPYQLRLRAVEADRIATPNATGVYQQTTGQAKNGNYIYDGVEVNGSGAIVAYHIRNTYPFEITNRQTEFVRVEAYGKATGMANVFHIMNAERPDQYRGVTILAPVIIPLLQINRYTESELQAALVQSYLTAFIETDADASEMPFNEATDDEVSDDPNEYELGPGVVNILAPGEKVDHVAPTHPTSGFKDFVEAVATQVGAALEVPRDILLKTFNASYSASRGALLEAWKSFRTYRTWFVNDFCAPAYEQWLAEAVAKGRVNAPGFFTDPAIRAAWSRVLWVGPSQGQLDPTKEIKAEIMAIQNGLSTREDAAMRLNGSDFAANAQQIAVENELWRQVIGTGFTATTDENEEEDDARDADGNEQQEE